MGTLRQRVTRTRDPRYVCGGIGHIARVCPTRTAQSAANANLFTSGAIVSIYKSAGQLFAEAVIGRVRITDALFDTGSALTMLSFAMYARLPSAPAIQLFMRAAPNVVGVEGASAEIRGYVDAPVEVAGVAVHHPVLVVEGLAFPLILRAHGHLACARRGTDAGRVGASATTHTRVRRLP